MWKCKKCGGKVDHTESIKNHYELLENGETGEFIDDYEGLDAKQELKCTKCGRIAKHTLISLKRIAKWVDE